MTASCWADGCIVPSYAIPVAPKIPDQQALIQFSNGVERLVIETRFAGEGTNFAWIVPLPSAPVIEAATAGLFPTLQALFQAPLRHDVTRYFQLFLGIISTAYLLRFVRNRTRGSPIDIAACFGLGLAIFAPELIRGAGSVMAVVCSLRVVNTVRRGVWTTSLDLGYLLFMFLLVFFTMGLLPALGSAGMRSTPTPSVTVLDRKLVGIYDTVTISSLDPGALRSWLKANGFAAADNRTQAIADYVKDGWVFVAAKIRRDDPSLQTMTPHPLSFTFKTEKAVYPMRLTGIDNRQVKVNLYVFGADQARAPHFKAERCTHPVYPALPVNNDFRKGFLLGVPESKKLQISHPLLRKWVDGSLVATKLTSIMTPDEMRDDVWLSWTQFSEINTPLYSRRGACIYALNWGVAAIATVILAIIIFWERFQGRTKQLAKLAKFAIVFSLLLGTTIYLVLPKTEVRILRGRMPRLETFEAIRTVEAISEQETNVTEVRAVITNYDLTGHFVNYLSGGKVHEEDSPGNYELRQSHDRVKCIFYDIDGAPCAE